MLIFVVHIIFMVFLDCIVLGQLVICTHETNCAWTAFIIQGLVVMVTFLFRFNHRSFFFDSGFSSCCWCRWDLLELKLCWCRFFELLFRRFLDILLWVIHLVFFSFIFPFFFSLFLLFEDKDDYDDYDDKDY